MSATWEDRLNKTAVIMICATLCLGLGEATVQLHSWLAFGGAVCSTAAGVCVAATIR